MVGESDFNENPVVSLDLDLDFGLRLRVCQFNGGLKIAKSKKSKSVDDLSFSELVVGKEQRNEGLKERKPKPNFDIDFRLRLSRSRIIEFGIRLRPNRISLFTRIFGRISAIFGTSAELFDFFCSLLKER